MYSSCPNVIKHFVPIKFSQLSLDSSSPKIKIDSKIKQIPFTNKKLQCLKNESKDYILIFKNKTFKDYSPRKKVKYSTLIKQMRKKNNQIIQVLSQEQDGKFCRIQPIENNKIQQIKPRKIMSVDKLRDMKIAIRDTRTTEDGKRTKIKNNTGRQTKATFRSAKQNQSNYNSLDNQIKNLIQFKIRGFKAPKSQTVDFYKKINLDSNYRLVQKLIQ